MTTGELIKLLADYCPDTQVEALDGNLLTGEILAAFYGEETEPSLLDDINDGMGGDPDTLYLMTP